MLLGIDHLVIAVRDPDAAAADFEKMLGLAATGGGRHERAGSFNRLIFLGDTYIELIGIWNRALAAANPIGAAAVTALDTGLLGLVTWAIATDGARREVASLRTAGSPIGDAVPGERHRPDGGVIRWHTAAAAPLGPGRPPFLIEHELAGPEWGDEARRARATFVHPFGGVAHLIGLELAVEHPADAAAEFARTLSLAFDPAAGDEPGDLEARVGGQSIRLVSSGSLSAGPSARVGLLATAGERLLVDVCGVRFARL